MHLRLRPASRLFAMAAAAATLCTFALPTPIADAHFYLESPESWKTQDAQGNPQKTAPCGDEAGGSPTGVITPFAPGDTVTITIDETIFHPGHYRVALSVLDRSELPAEPPVTPDGNDPCGSVPIQDPPVFPVLADGMLVHTQAFGGPQTIEVTLPSDITCEKCTLQILEFMSNHNPSCFYHHCADISIGASSSNGSGGAAASGVGGSSGPSGPSGPGAGVGGSSAGPSGAGGESSSTNADTPSSDEGCSCSVPVGKNAGFAGIAGALLGASLLLRRRRRAT